MVHIYFSHQFSSAWDSFIFKKEFLSPHFHQLVLMKLLSCFNQKVPWDSTCYIEHHINNIKLNYIFFSSYSKCRHWLKLNITFKINHTDIDCLKVSSRVEKEKVEHFCTSILVEHTQHNSCRYVIAHLLLLYTVNLMCPSTWSCF